MSADFPVARAVVYRFDEDKKYLRNSNDHTILFAVGVEERKGDFLEKLRGPFKPYDVKTTSILQERMQVAFGEWAEVFSCEGHATDIENAAYLIEINVFDQQRESEDIRATLDAAAPYLSTVIDDFVERDDEVPQIWCLNQDDTLLLRSLVPGRLEDYGTSRWRSLVTSVVARKADAILN